MENVRNSVRLTGFAGSDPVIITFENQRRMARVSIAVNEFYQNNSGELVNQTQWFSLIFWNKKIELIEKTIKKGSRFSIEGKLNSQRYTDKKGEPRYTFEIVVNAVAIINKDDGVLCVEIP
ncbi:single-stranded DNA-binding protein [Pedobacter nyackensis]|uniref:Single-stranded DNA-binding protein n=1 Tax=Pedobacter nyackensis TaxID=475255 RepID=A0A1W2EUF9_9SPHI|nr:single-stranded DNA-binding protein [Pedobacter nyackensis]SMD13343.1 single-strand DNA-binding protein [Pedobacter nyackensis]